MVVKAKQLRDRSIYIYLPTLEMANQWKKLADKAKMPISKFVIEHVENSLRQEQEQKAYESRAELLKQIREKDKETAELRQQLRLSNMLSENLDKELRRYRAQPFVEEDNKFEGVRTFDKELVELLRSKGGRDSDQILNELGINPKDTDLVKAVNKQLQLLQRYGLIEPTVRGWRWVA